MANQFKAGTPVVLTGVEFQGPAIVLHQGKDHLFGAYVEVRLDREGKAVRVHPSNVVRQTRPKTRTIKLTMSESEYQEVAAKASACVDATTVEDFVLAIALNALGMR
jgi:hypothetical protein